MTRAWSEAGPAHIPYSRATDHFLGRGPVFPGAYTDVRRWHGRTVFQMDVPLHPWMHQPHGWMVNKVLWKISRDYHGPVLIRGHEVGGPGGMRFGNGVKLLDALRFQAHGAEPSEVLVPSRGGCFGWQVDGRGFSRVLVFRARCIDGPGFRRCPGRT